MKNKTESKKESPNRLKCQITGVERVSNMKYLANKADQLGITVNEFRAHYVCKAALLDLKAQIERGRETDDTLEKYLTYNGKGRRTIEIEVGAKEEAVVAA